MSVKDEKSPKDCAEKKSFNFHNFNKKLYVYLSTVFLSFLALVLLVWLILHPTKPQFSLIEANINQFNFTTPSLLNSSIQLTLISNNPNKKVGIYYDEFLIHASYKGQKITTETPISPFYQEHEETNYVSAFLIGNQQPVASSFQYEVQRDQGITGKLILNFQVIGRLRWKVGTYVSGRYRFVVNCITFMPSGMIPSLPLRSRQGTVCSTTI